MEKDIISRLNKSFEEYAYEQDGIEYWLARELQVLLDYTQWRNFEKVIDKAKQSCKTTSEVVFDHFADVSKTIEMPNGAAKKVEDIMLTRYACYLIAQSYFAIQTRKQELLEERIQLMERLEINLTL